MARARATSMVSLLSHRNQKYFLLYLIYIRKKGPGFIYFSSIHTHFLLLWRLIIQVLYSIILLTLLKSYLYQFAFITKYYRSENILYLIRLLNELALNLVETSNRIFLSYGNMLKCIRYTKLLHCIVAKNTHKIYKKKILTHSSPCEPVGGHWSKDVPYK